MITSSHRLVYGYAEVSESISAFKRRVINTTLTSLQVLRFLGLPIKVNLDLETFKVRRFVLNHEESLDRSLLIKNSISVTQELLK